MEIITSGADCGKSILGSTNHSRPTAYVTKAPLSRSLLTRLTQRMAKHRSAAFIVFAAVFIVDSQQEAATGRDQWHGSSPRQHRWHKPKCEPGEYYGAHRVDSNGEPVPCAKCMPGFWGSGGLIADKPVCERCKHGEYSSEHGATFCTQCEQGKWQESTGKSTCL